MLSLCEHFVVCRKTCVPDGFIVEYCDTFDACLADFVIVCREHEVANVRDWIRGNVKSNVGHCLKMFDQAPQKILGFVASMSGIFSYTEEFVKGSGGIQNFLDKYAAEAQIPVQDEPYPVGEASDLSGDGEMDADLLPAAGSDNLKEDMPESQETGTLVASEEGTADTGQPILAQPVSGRFAPDPMPGVGFAPDPMPGAGFVQDPMPGADSAPDPMPGANPAPASVASSVDPWLAPLDMSNASKRQEVEIVYKVQEVHEIQDYRPELIERISDEDISESLRMLRRLNDAIALDGLDPDAVLSDTGLEKAYKKLTAYPPVYFKEFILGQIHGVMDNTQRYRVSALIDDFAEFLRNGGRHVTKTEN